MGVTCTRARASGDTGLRFPVQLNPSSAAVAVLVLNVPVGDAATLCPSPKGGSRNLWSGLCPPGRAAVARLLSECRGGHRRGSPPGRRGAGSPSCFSPKAGHVPLLRVVMVTASQRQQKVPLCIKLLPHSRAQAVLRAAGASPVPSLGFASRLRETSGLLERV